MCIKVNIPATLRHLTNNEAEISCKAETVKSLIEELDKTYPGMLNYLMDEDKISSFVNLYKNGQDIRFLDGLACSVKTGDVIDILPAVAGGASCLL